MQAKSRLCIFLLLTALWQDNLFSQSPPAIDLSDAPPKYKKLIERGHVRFNFTGNRSYDGETHFRIYITYQFSFKSRRVRSESGFAELLTISLSNLNVKVENEIRLPRAFANDEDFWSSRLVEHEFEHVRVNADPRVFMLAEYVLLKNNQVQVPLPNGATRASRQSVNEAIDRKLKENVKLCEDLVQNNNKLLDRITQHGMTTLESEPNFFRRLYTKENLEEQNFSALPLVTSLLRNRRYAKYQKESYTPD